LVFGELFHYNIKRMTEKEIINQWYEPMFDFDYTAFKFKPGTNGFSAIQMLYASTKEVGCAKSCCLYSELMICNFFPVIVEPSMIELSANIKPNKYLVKEKK